MSGHDIVVIGGSAGGVEALRRICEGLPRDFPAAVFVVIHISPTSRSIMPELLTRAGHLPARHPKDGEQISRGNIYVAPPDMHMLLRPGHVILRKGPHENRTRPAIDPLFRSAAVAYRSRVIGVVLSGLLDDGSAGLLAIKTCGGLCVVQRPDDAMWAEMPRSALAHDNVDYSVPVSEMPDLLSRLVREPPGPMPPIPNHLALEAGIAAQEVPMVPETAQLGRPSRLSCPQCGGVLNEVFEPGTTPISLPDRPCIHRRIPRGGAGRRVGARTGECLAHAPGTRGAISANAGKVRVATVAARCGALAPTSPSTRRTSSRKPLSTFTSRRLERC